MDRGSVYRRCGCRDKSTGKLLGAACPALRSLEHGTSAPTCRRRRESGTGRGAARRVRDPGGGLGGSGGARVPRGRTGAGAVDGRMAQPVAGVTGVAARLDQPRLRGEDAVLSAPVPGRHPARGPDGGGVQAMFTAVTRDEGTLGRPASAATLHRIHATLRAALNGAVRAGLISANPGRYPELPRAARPRPQVWTPALTGRWQLEGRRPAVGVWTAAQTSRVLAQVQGHRLYALFHLVALRGLRRGEAAGLRWSDLDLDAGTLTVAGQLQQLGGRLRSSARPSSSWLSVAEGGRSDCRYAPSRIGGC